MADMKVTAARARVAVEYAVSAKVTAARARVAVEYGVSMKVTAARARFAVEIPAPGEHQLGALTQGQNTTFY